MTDVAGTLRELAYVRAVFQLRAIEAIIRGGASVDTDRMAETTEELAPGEASVARSREAGDAQ